MERVNYLVYHIIGIIFVHQSFQRQTNTKGSISLSDVLLALGGNN
jgi:hypothetical protein